VRIIARFDSYKGRYMFHCHLLEHEDNGMMGQFLIE
jgi:spore coat protein A